MTCVWFAALASIGSGLSMSKEYRSVFEDLIEKVRHACLGTVLIQD